MLERVWERAQMAHSVDQVMIATADREIQEVAQAFGATVVMTDPGHPTGTDRIAQVAAQFPAPLIVNLQGDEPFLDPDSIDAAIAPLLQEEAAIMSTLMTRLQPSELADTNTVKVVVDRCGQALYFSRQPLAGAFKHLGLYVYRQEFLLAFAKLPRGPLEIAERLEQLRVLENGYRICVVETPHDSIGVDTELDLARAREHAESIQIIEQGAHQHV